MPSVTGALRRAIDATTLVGGASGECETAEAADERKHREAIVQGLLKGRAVWSGDFWQDYMFYLKQTHVLLSVVTSHKLHPFSRSERLFALLASLAASLGFALMLLDDEGEKDSCPTALMAGAVTSLIMAVLHFAMVLVMKCSCIQEGSCLFRWFGSRGRSKAEKCGYGIGWLLSLVSVLILVLGVQSGMDLEAPMEMPAQAWAYSQACSCVLSFLTTSFVFVFSYWGFRWVPGCGSCCWQGQAGPTGSKPAFCYPHGEEYPKDMSLVWDGDRYSCVRRSKCMALPACVVSIAVFVLCAALVTGMAFAAASALVLVED